MRLYDDTMCAAPLHYVRLSRLCCHLLPKNRYYSFKASCSTSSFKLLFFFFCFALNFVLPVSSSSFTHLAPPSRCHCLSFLAGQTLILTMESKVRAFFPRGIAPLASSLCVTATTCFHFVTPAPRLLTADDCAAHRLNVCLCVCCGPQTSAASRTRERLSSVPRSPPAVPSTAPTGECSASELVTGAVCTSLVPYWQNKQRSHV